MKTFLIINGPNLDMLGLRKPEVYGSRTYVDLMSYITQFAEENNIKVKFLQTYSEGEIARVCAHARKDVGEHEISCDGIVINAGAYSHYSIAIRDGIEANENIKFASVHISDIMQRESFRHNDVLKDVVDVYVKGLGFDSYIEGLKQLMEIV